MNGEPHTVADLGEEGLIERIVARIGPAAEGETWSGDDAALIRAPSESVVYTTDLLVENVDFDLSLCEGEDVGWKAMAINISDVAAMGARPTHAVASLSLRPGASVALVDGVIDGLVRAAREWGVALVGGDISRAEELTLGVAMLGAPVPGGPVHRRGARVGEAICVTGCVGGAAGGLLALRRGRRALSALVQRQLRPRPRVAEARALCGVGITSLIDVSDGLALDLGRLMRASGRGCRIDTRAVPVDPALDALPRALGDLDVDPLALALSGGEDFELLFTIAEEAVERARTALEPLGTPLTRIGAVTEEGRFLGERPLEHWEEKGWDHLRGR